MNIKFQKATVVAVGRRATLKIGKDTTFELPAAYATEDEIYNLDEGDSVFIHTSEDETILLVIPYHGGGLQVLLSSQDDGYEITEIKMITKEELNDL